MFHFDTNTPIMSLHQLEDDKVINDKINDKSIVLFSLYSYMVRVYDPGIGALALDFHDHSNKIILDK